MEGMISSLDDLAGISRTDSSGLLVQISALPSQLQASLSRQVMISGDISKVCVGGLGGSAMGGEVLVSYMSASASVPTVVVRDTTLPAWVDPSTLTILISYSGNTRETLSMFEEAKDRGANLVIITSGGKLLEHSRSLGCPVVTVPGGLQPRQALGHLLGSAARVVESAGLCPMASELEDMTLALNRKVRDLSPDVPTERNLAKRVARQLVGRMPFVYAPRSIRPAATRWQTQINENSKMLCLAGEVPEMDHNQVVGWVDGAKDERNAPVFLRPAYDAGMETRILDATISIFNDFGLRPELVDLEGSTPLEAIMDGIILGDYVSYYLAMLQGIDPLPVSSITELKKRLG